MLLFAPCAYFNGMTQQLCVVTQYCTKSRVLHKNQRMLLSCLGPLVNSEFNWLIGQVTWWDWLSGSILHIFYIQTCTDKIENTWNLLYNEQSPWYHTSSFNEEVEFTDCSYICRLAARHPDTFDFCEVVFDLIKIQESW